MSSSLKPHELVDIYAHARSARWNSWAFSLMACAGLIGGTTAFVSTHPNRIELTLGCFAGSLFLCDRAKKAGETASKYGRRVTALEQFSEETTIHLLRQSVAPSLPPVQLDAQLLESTGNAEADAVLQCLADYDVQSRFERAIKGPTFSRLFLKPAKGQKVSGIMNLGSELQLALGLENPPLVSVKPSGIAIDIPNSQRSILKFSQFIGFEERSPLEPLMLSVGVDLDGQLVELDLSDPNSCHCLGGGTTGSGKSEFLRTAILSLIGRYSPDSVMLAIADPKRVSFSDFADSPWMLAPVAKSPDEISALVQTLTGEMDRRYELLEESGVSDISSYNRQSDQPIPRIVFLFDEYGEALDQADDDDLKAIEKGVRRLAQKARASGIHLLLFTQRPDAKKLDPQLRSNLPASIGLKVQRLEESTIIMGSPNAGAENLLGKGDLLLRAGNEIVRLQAPLIDSPILVRKAIARFQSPAIAPSPSVPSQPPTLEQFSQDFTVTDPRKALEKMFNAPAVGHQLELDVPKPKMTFEVDDVLEELRPIVRLSMKQGGWIKAIDVKRNVRAYKSVSTETIREYFLILSGQGCGSHRGDGEMVEYTAFDG